MNIHTLQEHFNAVVTASQDPSKYVYISAQLFKAQLD